MVVFAIPKVKAEELYYRELVAKELCREVHGVTSYSINEFNR